MRTYDVSPLFRSSVGFDRLFDLLTQGERAEASTAWPPYNIEKVADDQYRITMAVAGFTEDEISLTSENNMLTVAAAKTGKEAETKRTFLHQGIAERNFKRQFRIADHVKVTGASLSNGLLHVELEREIPEAMKPRQIAISGVVTQKFLKSA